MPVRFTFSDLQATLPWGNSGKLFPARVFDHESQSIGTVTV